MGNMLAVGLARGKRTFRQECHHEKGFRFVGLGTHPICSGYDSCDVYDASVGPVYGQGKDRGVSALIAITAATLNEIPSERKAR